METSDSSQASLSQDPPNNFMPYGSGNAAYDVNTNTLTITGGKIKTGVIESTNYSFTIGNTYSNFGTSFDLDNGALISKQFAIDSSGNASFAGAIVGGSINIPNTTSAASFHVDSTGRMWSGANASNFGSAPFRVDASGNVTANSLTLTNASIGTGSSYTGNQIAEAFIGNLNASKITAGTIATGRLTATNIQTGVLTIGDGASTATLTFNQSTAGGAATNAFLKWSGGSKIWSDTVNDMGFNAIGGDMIFYCNSNQAFQLIDGSQALIGTTTDPNGLKVLGNFNVGNVGGTSYDARFNGGTVFFSNSGSLGSIRDNATDMVYEAPTSHRLQRGGTSTGIRVSATGLTVFGVNGIFMSTANFIDHGVIRSTFPAVTGTLKNAIVPTSQGFRALNCIEAPDVWFMDFCDEKGILDPVFEEVTVAPYRYIKCDDGGYQVWGKRRGHDEKRFETKTLEEFEANEKFLNMNKPV
jgi:hypothetical protein